MHPLIQRAVNGSPIVPLVEAFYGPNGPLAQLGWEIRPQQRQMSLQIAAQIDRVFPPGKNQQDRSWGITEAPCGTGKSLAYAVPGVLLAIRQRQEWLTEKETHKTRLKEWETRKAQGEPDELNPKPESPPVHPRKFIIATANIALQEQIIQKDLPALCAMLEYPDLIAKLLKGRNNYVCRYQIRAMGELALNPKMTPFFAWLNTPDCDGDKEHMPMNGDEFWGDVSVTTEDCTGQSCAHWGGEGKLCFWRQAIQGYEDAMVIVTNHHYLAMAKGMRAGLVAIDEMHELERSLRGSETSTLTEAAGRHLANQMQRFIPTEEAEQTWFHPMRWLIEQVSRYHLANQAERDSKSNYESPTVLPPDWLGDLEKIEAIEQAMMDCIEALSLVAMEQHRCFATNSGLQAPRYNKDRPEESEAAAKIVRAIDQGISLMGRWSTVARGMPAADWPASDLPWAIYADRIKAKNGQPRIIVSMTPADVGWATRALAGSYPCMVLTSATIQDFTSLRLSLGLLGKDSAPIPDYETRLPSPYDLPRMGVLVVPNGPNPKDPSWEDWSIGQVLEAVRLAKGGALVLASSVKQMYRYAWELKQDANWQGSDFRPRVRVQGEAGRGELRAWFKDDIDGVLVATRSFFQGLDVAGEACRLVIINRVPFGRPDDPVEQAVQQLLIARAGGGDGYMLRSIPEAAMVLAQGAGRLIRAQSDRGAVLLLDARVMGVGEGWKMLRNALPPFPVSREIQDIENLLTNQPLIGVAPPPMMGRARRTS
jgi:ATP-dependent DNA helicase DinG